MRLELGSASRPAAGQDACGDVGAFVPLARGTLLCLADGLGHGHDARAAAEVVCRYARAHAEEPLEAMLRGMDCALANGRGAAVSLLAIHGPTRRVQFAAIGNVELRALSLSRIAPPTTPGIVGRGVRSVRVWEYPLSHGDVLALVTDGISSRADLGALAHLGPQALAEGLVAKYHKQHDDGCCLVARVAAPARDA